MPRGDDWPLVGRADELATIAELLAGADRSGVVLAGPAGVGKTRLAEECATLATRAGFRVVRIAASDAARSIPLGALAHLLEPEPRRKLRADLLQRAAAHLSSGPTATLLVVDDGHLLDDASAAVIHHLALERAAFLAVTVRTGEAVPDPVLRLWKDGLAVRLDLAPLVPADVDDLLAVVLGAVDGATRRELWERSQGNALYLRELVLGGLESGALREAHGLWRLTGSFAASTRLTELVEGRLAGLDEVERRALELVSAGEPLDVALVESVVGPEALDALDARSLLAVDQTDGTHQLSLAHPLHGEVLRAALSPLRRRGVYRALAEAADRVDTDTGGGAGVSATGHAALRRALWQLEGGGAVDPSLMLRAARRAYFDHGDQLAERLARAALDAGAGAEAGVLLLQVLGVSGRHEERIGLATRLIAGPLDELTRAKVAMEWANALYWGRGDEAAALALLEEHAAAIEAGALRDELHALCAAFHLLSGRPVEAIEAAGPILESDDGRAFVEAATAVGPALAIVGQGERATSVAQRAYLVAGSLGEQDSMADPGLHVVTHILALTELGRLTEAAATADIGYDAAVAMRSRTGQGWFSLMRGRVALQTGDLAVARRSFAESSALLGEVGWPGAQRWAAAGRILAAAATGDAVAAGDAADHLERLGTGPAQMMEADVVRAWAWLAHVRADEAERDRLLDHAVALATDTGTLALAAQAWHDIARFGRASLAAPALGELAGRVDGPLTPARAHHAAALARQDAAELERAGEAFEGLGALLFAAEALAAASAARRRAGTGRAADALARRALALADRCPGAATPGLGLAGPGAALTAREREVAALAADGLASREIAARLGRSVRTVDNHLQRAYQKLGVSSRDDLPDALSPRRRSSA